MKFPLRVACPVIFLLPLVSCLPLLAETDPDVATYSIPANAVKVDASGARANGEKVFDYYPAGAETKAANRIAFERWRGDVLLERQLYKDNQSYGVQRRWYPNGQIASEVPYKGGVMDGTCKAWNQKGQLVAQYEMKGGEGIRRIYYDNGSLKEEYKATNKGQNWQTIILDEDGTVSLLMSFAVGAPETPALSFNKGVLSRVAWLGGPEITFNPDGTVKNKVWRSNGESLSESDYAAAASNDPALPPYYADARRYRDYFNPTVKALLQRYHSLSPVLIPLQLDEKGEAVTNAARFR